MKDYYSRKEALLCSTRKTYNLIKGHTKAQN